MKNLINTSIAILLILSGGSCRKEETPAKISGYVLEAGTNMPIRKAHVAIVGKDIITGDYSIIEDILADENGHYEFETTVFPDDKKCYVITASSDYYDYNDMNESYITYNHKSFNLYLVRKNITVLKIIRDKNLKNRSITFQSERQAPIYLSLLPTDSCITVNSNMFIETIFHIEYYKESGGFYRVDTTFLTKQPYDTFNLIY